MGEGGGEGGKILGYWDIKRESIMEIRKLVVGKWKLYIFEIGIYWIFIEYDLSNPCTWTCT